MRKCSSRWTIFSIFPWPQRERASIITAGFSIYKKEFKGNSRFKFIKLRGKGHGTVYYTIEGKNYHEKINKAYKRYVKKEKPNDEQKKTFLDNLIDRRKYNNLIDMKLMKKCLDFITK